MSDKSKKRPLPQTSVAPKIESILSPKSKKEPVTQSHAANLLTDSLSQYKQIFQNNKGGKSDPKPTIAHISSSSDEEDEEDVEVKESEDVSEDDNSKDESEDEDDEESDQEQNESLMDIEAPRKQTNKAPKKDARLKTNQGSKTTVPEENGTNVVNRKGKKNMGVKMKGIPTDEQLKQFRKISAAHVESFNYFLNNSLPLFPQNIDPVEFEFPDGNYVSFSITSVTVNHPTHSKDSQFPLFPFETRESRRTYAGNMTVHISVQHSKGTQELIAKRFRLPIMVLSEKCRLYGLNAEQLVEHNEEGLEMGGYFISNGNEKIIRLLSVPRRNYVHAVRRGAYASKGRNYSNYGCLIRCVREDQTSKTLILHYLKTGACILRFSIRKSHYFIPALLILKALKDTTDREIYERVLAGSPDNSFVADRLELGLLELKKYKVASAFSALSFIGSKFRIILGLPKRLSDKECGEYLMRTYVFVHLKNNVDKFNLLIHMLQKLFALAKGDVCVDNSDAPDCWEVLLPGFLFGAIVKERLEETLFSLRTLVAKDFRERPDIISFGTDGKYLHRVLSKLPDITKRINNFIATGNLNSFSGLDQMQLGGFTVIADKLNMNRYLSHFRAIHRGQFYTTMKTTAVRKLLPESWGFLCPAHTPDGAPCGLLNHLAAQAVVQTKVADTSGLPEILSSLGMLTANTSIVYPTHYLVILVDGSIQGFIAPSFAKPLVDRLRYLKNTNNPKVPDTLEIVYIPRRHGGQFPGIFLFSTPSRILRPVLYLPTQTVELIGTMEQVYLNIACLEDDVRVGVTTHRELKSTNILSINASFIPFSDFNQSPRNMYQCQMGKQTMAHSMDSFAKRSDNKTYRLLTPQKPLVRNEGYNTYSMDQYPLGTNAVVAVISYTGYDMEDAMIINKASYERGFAHACVYKNEVVDLNVMSRGQGTHYFDNTLPGTTDQPRNSSLDIDGFPSIGQRITKSDPLYSYYNSDSQNHKVVFSKSREIAYVEGVVFEGLGATGTSSEDERRTRAILKLRIPRNPIIGDKFSSRHGQKGVLSQLWPEINMPFTENGIRPDVIINPNAFPSRMTIGMLIESMAGKAGALHGMFQDSTPFKFDESNRAYEYFGEQLHKAGFNYYGNETMYSGVTGEPFPADIFIGVVYYQRLRHMVGDKYQVRATGPVNQMTKQPVKGRKLGGGIRFGEMERDSLLAHGTTYLLYDRLMKCSDLHKCYACSICGSILTPLMKKQEDSTTTKKRHVAPKLAKQFSRDLEIEENLKMTCSYCQTSSGLTVVVIPFVLRYLATELAAMNIRITLMIK